MRSVRWLGVAQGLAAQPAVHMLMQQKTLLQSVSTDFSTSYPPFSSTVARFL
jgi:hypothetical protein